MTKDSIATIGANLEKNFDSYCTKNPGTKLDLSFTTEGNTHTENYTLELVDSHQIEGDYGYSYKCITFKDEAGDLYIHFRGTGDGNWQYNEAAYSDTPSLIQTESLSYFDSIIEEHYQGQSQGKVYVSGHSQGGNTAQYVTVNSQYGDYIDTCISLDGPGFSKGIVEDAKAKYGEAYYERQRQKIYAYNGESDFVSPLGQEQIVPEGHTTIISTASKDGSKTSIVDYHGVNGMLDGDSLKPKSENSAFRQLVIAVADELKELPQGDQERVAAVTMKLAEYFMGNGEGENLVPVLTEQDLADLKEVLIPFLVDFLAEHPEMIESVLNQFVEEGIISGDVAGLIGTVLKGFNLLPKDLRNDILKTLGDFIVVGEDGGLTLRGDVLNLINGVISVIDFVKNNPIVLAALAVGVVLLFPYLCIAVGGIAKFLAQITVFVIGLYAAAEVVEDFVKGLGQFIQNTLNAISVAIKNMEAYFRSISAGGKYASSNPYMRADPDRLRSYAARLSQVNTRLVRLDRSLNSLYLQVGLLDVFDILQANLITGYSLRVGSAQSFLNAAADILESADNQALSYMGG